MLPLLILLVLCHMTSAWKSNLVTEATKCVGDDFLFHWPYSTRSDERSLPVFWVSDQNGTIGILYLDNFFPVSPRVQFDPSSGLTLKDLKTVDSGNYTVTVIGPNNTNINIQNVHLLVFEPPQTTNGRLEIFQVSRQPSSDKNIQLKCGHFINRGTPPVTVVWEGPDGSEIRSTNYSEGYFVLELPVDSTDGNYSCRLDLNSRNCLASDSPLLMDAVSVVGRPPTNYEKDLLDMRSQVEELKLKVSAMAGDALVQTIQSQTSETLKQTEKTVEGMREDIAHLKEVVEDMNETISRQDAMIKQQESIINTLLQSVASVQRETVNCYNATTNMEEKVENLDKKHVNSSQDLEDRIRSLEGSQTQLSVTGESLQRQVAILTGNNSHLYSELAELLDRMQEVHNKSTTESESILRLELTKLEEKHEETRQEFSSQVDGLTEMLSNLTSAVESGALSMRRDWQDRTPVMDSLLEEVRQNFTVCEVSLENMRLEQGQQLQSLRSELQALESRQNNFTDRMEREVQAGYGEVLAKLKEESDKRVAYEDHLNRLEMLEDERERNRTDDYMSLRNDLQQMSVLLESAKRESSLAEIEFRADLSLLNETVEREVSAMGNDQMASSAVLQQLNQDVGLLKVQQLATNTTLSDLRISSQSQMRSIQGLLDSTADRLYRNLTSASRQQVTEARSALEARLTSTISRIEIGERKSLDLASKVGSLETTLKKYHPVRLVGGSSNREGRVEILVGSLWGTVCDDGWDDVDAGVVCVSLGFRRAGARATVGANFGAGTGPIFLDDVACTGSEVDIRLCAATQHGTHNCGHTEDAGVICPP